MKSGNLNFLEPSGPLQACNGTALPLPLPVVAYTYTNTELPKAATEGETVWLCRSAYFMLILVM
jgi:hypothetical protein